MARKSSAPRVVAPMYNHTLVVFAPFGTDPQLSGYTGLTDAAGAPRLAERLENHAVWRALSAVAANGVNVCAYIDRLPLTEPTWHVVAPAGATTLTKVPAARIAMDHPAALSDLLVRARQRFPGTKLILALEGHGAGFLPHIDRRALSFDPVAATDGGSLGELRWRIRGRSASLYREGSGSPLLGMGCPLLPVGTPFDAVNHRPLSTPALREALSLGLGNDRLAVLHFNNCFNMSIEVLDTVQRYARFATGYPNYNFFTGCLAYPSVFPRGAAPATDAELASRFATQNAAALFGEPNKHPTAGCTIDLARMPEVSRRFGALAAALTGALERYGIGDSVRKTYAERIRTALRPAGVRRFDSAGDLWLDPLDELVDVRSFARAMVGIDLGLGTPEVRLQATGLDSALGTLQVSEAIGSPWMTEGRVTWNFLGRALTMNVLCPDPQLQSIWDWRSAFYLHDMSDARMRAVQPLSIDFMRRTRWRDFIIAYHAHLANEIRELHIRPAFIPPYPLCKVPNQL